MKDNLDFCIVGPQRTSTTWIYDKLLETTKVNLPSKVKETFFFDRKFEKGFSYYFSLFEHFNANHLTGEVAPTYFHNLETIKKIYNHNSNCKIIIIYREPIEKSISLYKHHYRKGRVGKDFKTAVKKMPEIIETGKYSLYTKAWKENFGKENVLLLNYNELKENPQSYLNKITGFLKIDSIKIDLTSNSKINQSSTPRFYLLAKIFASLVGFLRKYDIHFIVEFGKKIGLKSVFEGGKDEGTYEEERIWLKNQFSEDDFLF